jgi:hypothetical protein
MQKEQLKSLRAYESDTKQINFMCVHDNITQADVIRKLLQQYKKVNN